jgi:hypothetical protein
MFWWESPKERVLLKDRGVDGSMASELILGRLDRRMLSGFHWFSGQWRAVVYVVMNLRVLAARSYLRGGVGHADVEKKGSGTVPVFLVLRKNFRNDVPASSVIKIPWIMALKLDSFQDGPGAC